MLGCFCAILTVNAKAGDAPGATQDGDAEVKRILEALTDNENRRGFGVGPRSTGSIEFQSITFDINSATLTQDATAVLDLVARALQDTELVDTGVVIEGHTDARGSDAYNLALSERRAESVKHYLEGVGVPGQRLRVVGKGETELLDTSDPEAASNRRVRFVRSD